jgi:Cu+-exporting ATPase
LVKNAEALEILERVDTVVIDKTGTLTLGKPRVVSIVPVPGYDESKLLRLAASLEQASEHPLAVAIIGAAREKGLHLAGVEAFRSQTGRGIEGTVEGRTVAIGSQPILDGLGVPAMALVDRALELRRDGQTVVFILEDSQPAGMLGIADPIKESASGALDDLRREGLRVIVLTGDSRVTAEAGLSRWRATESTMPRRLRKPTLASRWALAPTWQSRALR